MPFRREIAAWLFASLIVRAIFFLLTPHVIDSADSILYLNAAQTIADGRFSEIYPRIPLLYSALAAGISLVTPDIEAAATVVSFVAGTLLVVPVFFLSHGLHGRHAARIAAMTIALWPWLADYSCRAAPEALYVLCWFAAAACAVPAVRGRTGALMVLPLALCAMVLSRPEGIVVAACMIVAALLVAENRAKTLARLAPSIVLMLVTVALHAWLVQNLTSSTGIPARFSSRSIAYTLMERSGETLHTALRLAVVTLPVMLGPALGIFALVGIFARLTLPRDSRAALVPTIAALAQFAAAASSTFPEPRYVMTTIVAVALWSAHGANIVSHTLAQSTRWRAVRHAPAALIVMLMLAGMWPNIVPPMLGHKSYKPLEYKIAGQWMRENLSPGLILTRKPQVGYYANMPTSGPAPEDTLDDLRARVIDAEMRYVVVDERYSAQIAPALRPLLDPHNAPAWLRLLRADLSPYADARIVVYEVVKDAPAP